MPKNCHEIEFTWSSDKANSNISKVKQTYICWLFLKTQSTMYKINKKKNKINKVQGCVVQNREYESVLQ